MIEIRSELGATPDVMTRARVEIARRQQRRALFGADADLAAEPAWDVLLALFVAGENGAVEAETLVSAMPVPASNAVRWIELIRRRGLVADRDAGIVLAERGRALVSMALAGPWIDSGEP